MVRQRSQKAAENDKLIKEAVTGVLSGKYKSGHEAAKLTGANRPTLYDRLAGRPSRSTARLDQQSLHVAGRPWSRRTVASKMCCVPNNSRHCAVYYMLEIMAV